MRSGGGRANIVFDRAARAAPNRRASYNPSSSSSTTTSSTADHIQDALQGVRAKNQLQVRIIQLEAAEKEACQIVKKLCHDVAQQSGVHGLERDITDLLSAILILDNLCKRVGLEKVERERECQHIASEWKQDLAKCAQEKQTLEAMIAALQEDKLRYEDQLAELNFKHHQTQQSLHREIKMLRETVDDLRDEKKAMDLRMSQQERKLMEVPRLEEEFQRNARGLVRQHEAKSTLQRAEFKKYEEEIKQVHIYRNKCQALEATVCRQREEIESLQVQNRSVLNRYQQLVNGPSSVDKRKPVDTGVTGAKSNGKTAGKTLDGNQMKQDEDVEDGIPEDVQNGKRKEVMRSSRPASAPALRTTAINAEMSKRSLPQRNEDHSHPPPSSGHKKKRKEDEGLRHNPHDVEEIQSLREQLSRKNDVIKKLAHKLSLARSYPLLAVADERDLRPVFNHIQPRTRESRIATAQRLSAWTQPTPAEDGNKMMMISELAVDAATDAYAAYRDEELESQSPEFLAEERELEQARIEAAKRLQSEYLDRVERTRKNNAPHIYAIRTAQSFAREVTSPLLRSKPVYNAMADADEELERRRKEKHENATRRKTNLEASA